VRQRSDDLIDDLELQLGSAGMTYMHIRIRYSHSAFSDLRNADVMSGISDMQTRVETNVTAVIKRHNAGSPWSPRPVPGINPLVEIARLHWSQERAAEAVEKILAGRLPPRKPAKSRESLNMYCANGGSEEALRSDTRTAPPVPARRASLTKDVPTGTPTKPFEVSRKAWAELRRISSGSSKSTYQSRISPDRVPSSSTCPVVREKPRALAPRSRKENLRASLENTRESMLRTRRSLGPDALQSLVPTRSADIVTSDPGRTNNNDLGSEQRVRIGGTLRSRNSGKRESGRWGWTGWW
jgi:hypothetical protein